jgi:hypothetical protein
VTIIIVIHITITIIIYFFLHSSRAKLPGDIYNFAGDIVLDENITITTNGTTKQKKGNNFTLSCIMHLSRSYGHIYKII